MPKKIIEELSRGIPRRRADWNPTSLALRTIHPELFIEGMKIKRWPEELMQRVVTVIAELANPSI